MATGKESRPSLTISSDFYAARFFPDGKRFVALMRPYSLELWDVQKGKLPLGAAGVEMAKVEVKVGDPKTGKGTEVKQSTSLGAEDAQVTPDGQGFLISMFGNVAYYDLKSDAVKWRRRVAPYRAGPNPYRASRAHVFAFSPVDKTVAIGCTCGHIALLDWTTGKEVGFSREQPDVLSGPVDLLGDDATLLVRELMTESLSVRDSRTGKELTRHRGLLSLLAAAPDGERLALYGWKGEDYLIKHVNARTGQETWQAKAWPIDVAYSADGKVLAYKDLNDRAFHLVDAATGKPIHTVRLPAKDVERGADQWAIAPDLKRVAAQDRATNEIQLWDAAGKKLWTWQAPKDWSFYCDVRFLPDGKHLLANSYAGEDSAGVAVLLDADTGKKLHHFECERYPYVAMSPNGRYFVLERKGKRELREVASGRVMEWGTDLAYHFAFAAGGKFFAHDDLFKVVVRELPTGKIVNTFERPEHRVKHLSFAPNGRSIALVYADGAIWLWDALGRKSK